MPVATGRHYVICSIACMGLSCKGQLSLATNEKPSAEHGARGFGAPGRIRMIPKPESTL